MADADEFLRYHGRRSVDELVGALNADHPQAALAHKSLSLLHLDRFVAMITIEAGAIMPDSASASPGGRKRRRAR